MSVIKIDNVVLGNIDKKIKEESFFSSDFNEKTIEKQNSISIINEPIRRLEFNILLSMCEKTYIPYKSLKLVEQDYLMYSKINKEIVVKIKKDDILEIFNILTNSKNLVYLVTLDYKETSKYIWFKLKEAFLRFCDNKHITNDYLYSKLCGLGEDSYIKTLYYFIYNYKYDFLNIIDRYSSIYNEFKLIEDYFSVRGYHKKLYN